MIYTHLHVNGFSPFLKHSELYSLFSYRYMEDGGVCVCVRAFELAISQLLCFDFKTIFWFWFLFSNEKLLANPVDFWHTSAFM